MSEKVNITCKEFVKIELIRRKDDDAQEYNEQTRYTQVRSAGTRAALYTMAVCLNGEANPDYTATPISTCILYLLSAGRNTTEQRQPQKTS